MLSAKARHIDTRSVGEEREHQGDLGERVDRGIGRRQGDQIKHCAAEQQAEEREDHRPGDRAGFAAAREERIDEDTGRDDQQIGAVHRGAGAALAPGAPLGRDLNGE